MRISRGQDDFNLSIVESNWKRVESMGFPFLYCKCNLEGKEKIDQEEAVQCDPQVRIVLMKNLIM